MIVGSYSISESFRGARDSVRARNPDKQAIPIVLDSGLRALSALTRVFDALWRGPRDDRGLT
jgi:hypothetical protein